MIIDSDIFNKAIQYKIDYTTHIKLQKIALQHLGLTNINHIRDRFEGQAYYDNFLVKAYSEVAMQRIFYNQVFKIENKIKKSYSPSFEFKGKKLFIINSKLTDYPLIPKLNFDIAVVIFVNVNSRETYIIGWMNYNEIVAESDKAGISPLSDKHYHGYFTKLDLLKDINTLFNTN